MIQPNTTILLSTGEEITAAEVYEGLVLLAESQSSFPLLTKRDKQTAVVQTALDALEFQEEKE